MAEVFYWLIERTMPMIAAITLADSINPSN